MHMGPRLRLPDHHGMTASPIRRLSLLPSTDKRPPAPGVKRRLVLVRPSVALGPELRPARQAPPAGVRDP